MAHNWSIASLTSRSPTKKIIVGASIPEKIEHWNPRLAKDECYHFYGFPGILSALPDGDNVTYCHFREDLFSYDPDTVEVFYISFWLVPEQEVFDWMKRVGRDKFVVGGPMPTTNPELFLQYAGRIVLGACDDIEATLAQPGQVVKGITSYKRVPRYDLYDYNSLMDRFKIDKSNHIRRGYGIFTTRGCYNNCEFCISAAKDGYFGEKEEKPFEYFCREVKTMVDLYGPQPDAFICDSNFLQESLWREKLQYLNEINFAGRYGIYASADAFTLPDDVEFLRDHKVRCVVLGLEDINRTYAKHYKAGKYVLTDVCDALYANGIGIWLTYIIDLEDILEEGSEFEHFYRLTHIATRLHATEAVYAPLIALPNTPLWDRFMQREDGFDPEAYKQKIWGIRADTKNIAKFFAGEERADRLAHRVYQFTTILTKMLRKTFPPPWERRP